MLLKKFHRFVNLVSIVILLIGTLPAQAESLASPLLASGDILWAKSLGGTNFDSGTDIAIDSSGNVYTMGYFDGTADFDPGPGTFELTSAGGTDIFVSKVDGSGNFIWAKNMGGPVTVTFPPIPCCDFGYDIAIDSSGNVYTTVAFQGTADFDPGAGTFNLTGAGGSTNPNIFVSKLDSNGDFVWAKRMGGVSASSGYSIAVDSSGNIYTTGHFRGTADFDPGAGTFKLNSAGDSDIFVSKVNSNGVFLWAKRMGGTSYEASYGIAVDSSGNVCTTGEFGGTADFNPGAGTFNLTSAGDSDIFVSKLNSNGNFVWAKKMGGTFWDYGTSIAQDSSGSLYTTGAFTGTADLDPGAGTFNLTSAGDFASDVFVSKLNSSGDFVWAKSLGGEMFGESAYGIAVDLNGNVLTTGSFGSTADFDPGPETFNLTSAGEADIFVSKLNSSGNFIWAKGMGGPSGETGSNITPDSNGNVYTTGRFQDTADFDPGPGTFDLTSAGDFDVFISKLENDVAPRVTSIVRADANPTSETSVNFTVTFSEPVTGVNTSLPFDDFVLTTTGVTGTAITNVAGSDATYTVTVNTGSGDGTIRLDVVDDDSIADAASNPLGEAGAGNGDFTSGEIYGVNKLTDPIASQDGWILESSEISNAGGTLNKNATTLRIGDDAANKQYRSILSFDTPTLPEGATITSVTLKFKSAGKTGTLPFGTHGNLLVDIWKGGFRNNTTLQLGDFSAQAALTTYKAKVLSYTNNPVDNWYSQTLNVDDYAYLNFGGVTQFRLRFTKDDNNDFGADYLKLYSGNATVAADRPQLVIEYDVP